MHFSKFTQILVQITNNSNIGVRLRQKIELGTLHITSLTYGIVTELIWTIRLPHANLWTFLTILSIYQNNKNFMILNYG